MTMNGSGDAHTPNHTEHKPNDTENHDDHNGNYIVVMIHTCSVCEMQTRTAQIASALMFQIELKVTLNE